MTPPVFLEGEGALLDDGTFIPAAAIARAVDLIARACELIAALRRGQYEGDPFAADRSVLPRVPPGSGSQESWSRSMSEPVMTGYDPSKHGCTDKTCTSQDTVTLDGRFGRRCSRHAPWLELARAGLVADAFALLSAYLGRRSA